MLEIDEIKNNRKEKRLLTKPRAGSLERKRKQKTKLICGSKDANKQLKKSKELPNLTDF